MRRLRDLLRSDILHGVYLDAKMPGESELMAGYAVPRAVVREALDLLRTEGLVDRLRGYGTIAVANPQRNSLVDGHGIDHVPRHGFWSLVTDITVLAQERVRTPDAVRRQMPEATEEVLQLDYLMRSDGDVVAIATNYFKFPEAGTLENLEFRHDFYEFLGRGGLTIGATEFALGASTVDPVLAETIRAKINTPLITLEQTIFDMTGSAFDVAYIWMRADRVMLSSFAAHPDFRPLS
ncbi:GntR family transcriptional regulator [Microlunatus soli]|uniref:GntR family transcriptional regulator n=1 Tax=Microlunatus soli TaxID=630515 RepID=A0A1H1Z417_9ACTN|nr:GntR family transcriptional regulator [Microlunatus soli]